MPKVKNGKVSLNLKLSEDMYNRWVKEAGRQGILNLSEFIRYIVERGIKENA